MITTRQRLDAYLECERRILTGGQNISAPDGRRVGMPELPEVRAQIDRLRRALAAEQRGGISTSFASFCDDDCDGRRGFRR